jgi:Ca-activated chloride channel family protein
MQGHLNTKSAESMKIKTLLFFIVIFSLCGFDLLETRTITGSVTSSEDGSPLSGVSVVVKGTATGTQTDADGKYSINVPEGSATLVFSFIGLKTKEVKIDKSNIIDVVLEPDATVLNEVIVVAGGITVQRRELGNQATTVNAADVTQGYSQKAMAGLSGKTPGLRVRGLRKGKVRQTESTEEYNDEDYEGVTENVFQNALQNPLSTFSIDVDAASYSNIRRFINNGQRPPADAVRIEEMINYFKYDYDQPAGDHPFNIITEISSAPWNKKHKLVSVGLQGKGIPTENLPASNLVFLIDVSGSMSDPNKLPLLKASFNMLVNELREQDYVSIVVYAGAAGLVLEPTSGAYKEKIIVAMDNLQAGGSTAGGAGITLAYKIAKENFKKNGNNRVILATDGDFNVGASDNKSMEELIEEKRKDGIFLTVLGYGMGNYKDSKMEILADKGNGNYAYIDNLTEARKVLVNEFGGTLFTIAKDVKLQVEFNPAKVKAYRLIGYENRMLKSEDFNNDRKDAGELGSGHTVTALYEIIPAGLESEFYKVDELKYQKTRIDPEAVDSKELMTVKFRYKKPDGDVSQLIVHPLVDNMVALESTSDNFRWAASVAAFGMLLRESEYVNGYSYDRLIGLAEGARGKDNEGYRVDFINLAKSFGSIASRH